MEAQRSEGVSRGKWEREESEKACHCDERCAGQREKPGDTSRPDSLCIFVEP